MDATFRHRYKTWLNNANDNKDTLVRYGAGDITKIVTNPAPIAVIYGSGPSLEVAAQIPVPVGALTVGNHSNLMYLASIGKVPMFTVVTDASDEIARMFNATPTAVLQRTRWVVSTTVDHGVVARLALAGCEIYYYVSTLHEPVDEAAAIYNHALFVLAPVDPCAYLMQAGHVVNQEMFLVHQLNVALDLGIEAMFFPGVDLSFADDLLYGCPRLWVDTKTGVAEMKRNREVALENILVYKNIYTDALNFSYLQNTSFTATQLQKSHGYQFYAMAERTLLSTVFQVKGEYTWQKKNHNQLMLDFTSSTSTNAVEGSST